MSISTAVEVRLPDLLDGIARDVRRIIDIVPLEQQLDHMTRLAINLEEMAKAMRERSSGGMTVEAGRAALKRAAGRKIDLPKL
jgi:hypothetical protein